MASLMQSKGAAVRGFYRKAEQANPSYQCPYSDKDFSVDYQEFTNKKDSVLIIRIRMPEPEISPLCRAVYLCYGAMAKRRRRTCILPRSLVHLVTIAFVVGRGMKYILTSEILQQRSLTG